MAETASTASRTVVRIKRTDKLDAATDKMSYDTLAGAYKLGSNALNLLNLSKSMVVIFMVYKMAKEKGVTDLSEATIHEYLTTAMTGFIPNAWDEARIATQIFLINAK